MKLKNKFNALLVAFLAAISMGIIFTGQQCVDAARTDMVDTSNHNGYMTYANYYDMLVHYGVKSVVQKVSEGTSYVDPTAKYNLASAKQAGLYINAYHFARYTTIAGAQAEARHAVASAQAAGLPIGAVLVDDVEASEQQYNSYSSNAANNAAFMAVVEAAGYRTCVYTSGSWVGTRFPVSKGWIAAYPGTVTHDEYTGHHGWQWSSSFYFNGSYGRFDVSQLYDDFFTANQTPAPSVPVAPTPTKTVNANVTYATHQLGGGWLSDVTNAGSGSQGYAGVPNRANDLLTVRVDHGSVRYRVHTAQSGWLGWVYKSNKADTVNGAAGIVGQAIDKVQVYYTTPSGETYRQAYYRTQTTKRAGWLPAVRDDTDYAGITGEPMDRLQIEVAQSNPF